MRKSKRTQILDAVISIIQREGVTAVTFDAVAAETGLTRGGLLYHFPSREALVLATHQHLAGQWEAAMERAAGGTAGESEEGRRHAAYVRTSAEAATRAELLLMLESVSAPALENIWREVFDRWGPPVPDENDSRAIRAFIARLASDGLWSFEALSARPLPARVKQKIVDELVAMASE
jgi:AcrR family transcriptional regulator